MLISQLPTTIAPNDPEHIAASDVVHAALKAILDDSFVPTLYQINDVNGNDLIKTIDVPSPVGYFQFAEGGGGYPGSSFNVNDDVNPFTQLLIGVKGEATFTEEIAETGPLISIAGHIEGTLNAVLECCPRENGVNFLRITSMATGEAPKLCAVGPDAVVGMDICIQGDSGDIRFFSDLGQNDHEMGEFHAVPGGVNYLRFHQAAAGAGVGIEAKGLSADIGISYQTKGTGKHLFDSVVAASTDNGGTAGYTTLTGASGTPVDAVTPAMYLKVYYGTAAHYVPAYV